jgi:hypothetical protein
VEVKPSKSSSPLPTRAGLNTLGKSGRTIIDYAKAVPAASNQAEPASILNLRNPRRSK